MSDGDCGQIALLHHSIGCDLELNNSREGSLSNHVVVRDVKGRNISDGLSARVGVDYFG